MSRAEGSVFFISKRRGIKDFIHGDNDIGKYDGRKRHGNE